MRKKYHKPPSRIKYEQNHPVVSFRIEKSLLDKLNSFLEKNKLSKPDFIKRALKEQEETYNIAIVGKYNEGFADGRVKGNMEGYNKGRNEWAIWVYCWRCRQQYYIIPNSEDHTKTIQLMQGHLGHDSCIPKFY